MGEILENSEFKPLTIDDLGFESPGFSQEQIAAIAQDFYGITGQMSDLGGERDQNIRISVPNGGEFVLKISGAREHPETVDFQVKALLHVASKDPDLPVPRMIRHADGQWVQKLESGGEVFHLRLLTYLPGIPYSSGPFPSEKGLFGIGEFLARLDRALSDFTHPASGMFMAWDIGSRLPYSDQFRNLVPEEVKSLCLPMLDDLEGQTQPALSVLRRQVIHQDAHGWNLLRAGRETEEVVGMIDFGDMIEGPLVNDLAICASHFMERCEDPQGIARSLCEGYNSVVPLKPGETDLLLDLVIKRQILTLQLFEFRRLNMPHDPPQDAEEKPRIIASLERLASLDKKSFRENLRSACFS